MPFKEQNLCHITPKTDIQEKPLNFILRGFVSKTNILENNHNKRLFSIFIKNCVVIRIIVN